MRIAICDHEEQELSRLSELLAEYRLSRRICLDCQTFQSSTDFLCRVKGGEYDLILMDSLMPGFSRIQAERELRDLDKNVKLIILTPSPEFALESYRGSACQYLLKPAAAETLFPLLDKIQIELTIQKKRGFVLRERRLGIVHVSFSRLEYVEVMNKIVSFHLSDGAIREVNAALSDFEGDLLSRPEFLKIHRSYLVNLKYVQAINSKGVVTRTGHTLPISRLQYNSIKDAYICFLFQNNTDLPSFERPPKPDQRPGPWRILLVDDEIAHLSLWADILQDHGCVVATAQNGALAMEAAADGPWDCVLLDVVLPGENSFSLCRLLQEAAHAPVIFLSCLTDTDMQIQGFSAGGADYITKDTPAPLFWAKIETRIKLAMSEPTKFCFGPLLLDLTARKVLVGDDELALAPMEFDLLWRLSEHPGRIFTPEDIFGIVWGNQPWDGGQLVQVHMSRLRRKLEKACNGHCFIETVWGQGYRFVPVEENWPASDGKGDDS